MPLILGYAGMNMTLHASGVRGNRTTRAETIRKKNIETPGGGIQFLIDLYHYNLLDIYKIMRWNVRHKYKFFRINSDIAPHITNPEFLPPGLAEDYHALVYDPGVFAGLLAKIGECARRHKIRVTFHPDPFVVINSRDPGIVLRATRDLYFHSRILELMNAPSASVCILHVGGVYGEKSRALQRFIDNFNTLPANIKSRIVLENDETGYNVFDCLRIHKATGVPIVFDIFHHKCYCNMLASRGRNDYTETDVLTKNTKLIDIFRMVADTYANTTIPMKMHLSEQARGASMGTHADYVKSIPRELFTFVNESRGPVYLMIEAKMKELAVEKLRKKYASQGVK